MARGKEAARTARRREQEANETVEALRVQMKEQKEEHHAETEELKSEIRRLRADHLAEAGRIAGEEVERRLAQAKEERRQRGMSDDIARHLMYSKDRFVRNACRYISMTEGVTPERALPRVMTWMTDEDFYGVTNPVKLLINYGLPRDGWVWMKLAQHKGIQRVNRSRTRRNLENETPIAVTLDHAERDGSPEIHPDYKPEWYPHVEYGGIVPVDDDGKEADL